MRNKREPGWLKVLGVCWVIATLAIIVRVLVFLPSGEETAAQETGSAEAARPLCTTRHLRISCFQSESGS